MPFKVWVVLVIETVLLAVLLFGTAGRIDWMPGWIFLGLFFLSVAAMALGLARHDPGLLDERLKFAHAGQPDWDRVLLAAFFVTALMWLAIPGLDQRLGWSQVPLVLQIIGGIAVPVSCYFQYRVMRHNTYLAPTVAVQDNRNHTVISTGPYGIVRHPFYAVAAPIFPAIGLLLGSWWAVVSSVLPIGILAYRAVREERHLAHELEGYAAYMQKVRHRLLPHVW